MFSYYRMCSLTKQGLAYDVDRTYKLIRAGYHVEWSAIPCAITPMNRILIATPT